MADVKGKGTADDPWILRTPPGKSEFEAFREPDSDPPALVVQVGSTQLRAGSRSAGVGRGRTQCPQQPDARHLSRPRS